MSNELKPSFYAIIPASVRYEKSLPPAAKLLYAEITSLAQSKGYCWANNEYFAKLYEVSERTIRRWIEQLTQLNFIRIAFNFVGGKNEIDQRLIYISDSRISTNQATNTSENDSNTSENI